MDSRGAWRILVVACVGLLLFRCCSSNPEVDALTAFRSAVQDPQHALQSWDPTLVDPCTWFYITCDGNNHVVRLDLANLGLSGTLVPELGNLPFLQHLELLRNHFHGSIPKELQNLKQLVALNMYGNRLSGPIPTELGQLSKLQFLQLQSNELSGHIPPSLSDITTLLILNLSNNQLDGPIPTGGCFTKFTGSSFAGNPGLCGKVIHKPC